MQYLLAKWELSAGNLDAARSALETAKTSDPKFTAADVALAEIEVRENRPDAAQARLRRAVAGDPNNIGALLELARLEARAENRSEAIAHCRSVLEVDGTNVAALNNMAYYMSADDPAGALKFAQQVAETLPNNAAVQDTLGWIYYRKGLYRLAVPHLSSAVDKEPTPQRQFHLALCYLQVGERDAGQKMLQTAVAGDPNLRLSQETLR
jgi:tetratricopeptide (TPR) repeat protein